MPRPKEKAAGTSSVPAALDCFGDYGPALTPTALHRLLALPSVNGP